MSKKLIIVILIFLVVIFVAWMLFFKLGFLGIGNIPTTTNKNSSGETSITTPLTPMVTDFPNAPQGDSFAIGTPEGSVTVKNFYKLPVMIDGELLIIEDTNDYQITYDTLNSQFYIYASSSPVVVSRQEGESAFLSVLGISREDACKLDVAEGSVTMAATDTNYLSLSFCASSTFGQ